MVSIPWRIVSIIPLNITDLAFEESEVVVWHLEASKKMEGDTHFSFYGLILSEIIKSIKMFNKNEFKNR